MRIARSAVVVLTALAALLACSAQNPADTATPRATDTATSPSGRTTAGPAARPHLEVGKLAWVSVSVATVWRSPASVRAVDAPALARPARIREWLRTMTIDQRRDLGGRADTQALLGDRVRVVALQPDWARVRVADQPNPGDRGGYDGWVPRRQLTAHRPARSAQVVTVLNRTAWLRTDDAAARRRTEISFATRLPYAGRVGPDVRVVLPTGATRRLRSSTVVVHARGSAALTPTRKSIVATATSFQGLDYLWSGRSGFGLDCSGLTSLTYRVHGVVIPRDAAPESDAGTPVASGDWRRGDLLFYATSCVVHHVSMYAGRGLMGHAPGTGQSVEVVPVRTDGYWNSRSYLD